MADKHPYIPSPGYLVQVMNQLRKSFPATVTSETLKKLGLAPKNESYVLNILRFLQMIDKEGNRTDRANKVFTLHDDSEFAKEFAPIVADAYRDLFELHGQDAWNLDTNKLISFFRSSDGTTELVGKLQTSAFQNLSVLAGHRNMTESKGSAKPVQSISGKKSPKPKQALAKERSDTVEEGVTPKPRVGEVGLTVRIEINLPADGDQATYDRIFQSIRENLLNG